MLKEIKEVIDKEGNQEKCLTKLENINDIKNINRNQIILELKNYNN